MTNDKNDNGFKSCNHTKGRDFSRPFHIFPYFIDFEGDFLLSRVAFLRDIGYNLISFVKMR